MAFHAHTSAGGFLAVLSLISVGVACSPDGTLAPNPDEGSVVLDYGAEGNAAAGQASSSFDAGSQGCPGPDRKVAGTVVEQSFNSWSQDKDGKPVPNATGLAADLERVDQGSKPASPGADQFFKQTENFAEQQPDPVADPLDQPETPATPVDDGQIDLSPGDDSTPTEETPAEPLADTATDPLDGFELAGGQDVSVNCGYRMIDGKEYYVANVTTPVTQHSAIYVNKMAAHLKADLVLGRGEDAGINQAIAKGEQPYVRIEDGVINRQYRMSGFDNDGTKATEFTPVAGAAAVDQFSPDAVFRSGDTNRLASTEGVQETAKGTYKIRPGAAPIENNTYACGNMLAQLLASRNGDVTTANGEVKFDRLKADTGVYFMHGPAHDPKAKPEQQRANAEAWRNTTNTAIGNYFRSRK